MVGTLLGDGPAVSPDTDVETQALVPANAGKFARFLGQQGSSTSVAQIQKKKYATRTQYTLKQLL